MKSPLTQVCESKHQLLKGDTMFPITNKFLNI